MSKCGCRYYSDGQWSWHDIQEFCPLHAAAPELLAVVKECRKIAITPDCELARMIDHVLRSIEKGGAK